jgi:RNA polymerase sigma-70 factor (ECF subfamily)
VTSLLRRWEQDDNWTMTAPESDATAIAASMADPGRFGVLFDRHATVLLRYLVRRVGPDAADNMLGEVFRIAFERRSTFDHTRADARPWLYGIATNLLANRRRQEARRLRATARLVAQRTANSAAEDDLADTLDARDLWPVVADAIAALPDLERDVLLLHVWEELSYADIAASLGVPIGTVRSRLNRARTKLRQLNDHDARLAPAAARPARGSIGP